MAHRNADVLYVLYKEGRNTGRRTRYEFVDGYCGPFPWHQARQGVAVTGAHMVAVGSQRDVLERLGLIEPLPSAEGEPVTEDPALPAEEDVVLEPPFGESGDAEPADEEAPAEEAAHVQEDADGDAPVGDAPAEDAERPAVLPWDCDPADLDWNALQARVKGTIAELWTVGGESASYKDDPEVTGGEKIGRLNKEDAVRIYNIAKERGYLDGLSAPAE